MKRFAIFATVIGLAFVAGAAIAGRPHDVPRDVPAVQIAPATTRSAG